MRFIPFVLATLAVAVGCRQIEVERLPMRSERADTASARYGTGFNLSYLIEGRLGTRNPIPKAISIRSTPSGYLHWGKDLFGGSYYYGYPYTNRDQVLYKPTERFVIRDSVQVDADGRPAFSLPVYSYLGIHGEARRQTPLWCPAAGTLAWDSRPLLGKLTSDTATGFTVFRQPKLGTATLENDVLTYATSATRGTDTLTLALRGIAPLALRILIGLEADPACMDRLELRPDTIHVGQTPDRSRTYQPLSALLGNDDFCPGYLDLTSLELTNDNPSFSQQFWLYPNYARYDRFDQGRFIARQQFYQFGLNGDGYSYSISTIGGVRRQARVVFVP